MAQLNRDKVRKAISDIRKSLDRLAKFRAISKVVPESYSQCFEILGKEGLIPKDLARNLGNMCKFRNRLIHMYWDIDYKMVYEIIQKICQTLKCLPGL